MIFSTPHYEPIKCLLVVKWLKTLWVACNFFVGDPLDESLVQSIIFITRSFFSALFKPWKWKSPIFIKIYIYIYRKKGLSKVCPKCDKKWRVERKGKWTLWYNLDPNEKIWDDMLEKYCILTLSLSKGSSDPGIKKEGNWTVMHRPLLEKLGVKIWPSTSFLHEFPLKSVRKTFFWGQNDFRFRFLLHSWSTKG